MTPTRLSGISVLLTFGLVTRAMFINRLIHYSLIVIFSGESRRLEKEFGAPSSAMIAAAAE